MTTLQKLQVILKDDFGIAPEVLRPDADLAALDIDSLSMIEILFEVEDEFRITIPSEPASWRDQILTVGDLVDYVDRLVDGQRLLRLRKESTS